MGLSLALNTARSSLQASSAQMAVVSRNTAGANDAAYSRKIATLVATDGSARVVVARASDNALFFKMLATTSHAATDKALLDGLDKLRNIIGDTDQERSPAALMGAFNNALQQYANKPDNASLASAALRRGQDLATVLNEGTAAVQRIRVDADAAIATSVKRINDLLVQFDSANKAVVTGTAAGADISDNLDARDKILAQLSQEIGVTAIVRDGNDMAIYTDSGVPLFERSARSVSYMPTFAYGPGTVGGAVIIDGVQVTGPNSPMPINSGAIAGLVKVRDEIAVTYQSQLDTIASGLIEAFAESDQAVPPALPQRTGLFTYPGGPLLPGSATGLAGQISVNPLVDPAMGGNLELLRDGGINGASYRYNPAPPGTNTAFAGRLNDLISNLSSQRSFPASLGLVTAGSLQDLATSSVAWVEGSRQSASQRVDYQTALLGHASEALSNAKGVNTDEETALMLQLEKSYSASAKLISIIDSMLKTLMSVVG